MDSELTEYAGFWIRFVAYLVDGIIIGFIEGLLILLLLVLLGYNTADMESVTELEWMNIDAFLPMLISVGIGIYSGIFLLTWFYYALMQSGPRQATIGKMILRLKVTDINGDRLTFARASLRYFLKIISGAILMIGYIMAGFTDKKQALHDIIANTYVIQIK
jgi:uncharacterized RDD family membrane protein YckC